MMRSISIFGATGSIGESTFDLILRAGGADTFHTVALTGSGNIKRLAEMARALRAEIAVTADPARRRRRTRQGGLVRRIRQDARERPRDRRRPGPDPACQGVSAWRQHARSGPCPTWWATACMAGWPAAAIEFAAMGARDAAHSIT